MEYFVQIETRDGKKIRFTVPGLDKATAVASLAFGGGAVRCWVDGKLVAGPMGELLDKQTAA